MSWEDVSESFDHTRPEDIVVRLDLRHFTELVGRVASETHRYNDLAQFDPNSDEAKHIAVDAWRYVCHMADRVEFEKSVAADLAALEPDAPLSSTPEHRPEFGGAAPLRHTALERRMEPPV